MDSAPAGRIGIVGGTFDPIHLGHLVLASEAAHALRLDTVIFVPAGQPWQKSGRSITEARHRLAMVRLAIAPDSRFEASTVDIDRPGPTYTADTLADLRAELGPDAALFFIAGADAMAGRPTWHRADVLASLATFVAVARPGHPAAGLPDDVVVVSCPQIGVSSSDCRARVADGRPLAFLVPPAVEAYIAEHGLYAGIAT